MESYGERMARIERERARNARNRTLIIWGVVLCVLLFWSVVALVAGHVAKWW